VIISFRHKGLERFFLNGSARGIPTAVAPKLRLQLAVLNTATSLKDLQVPAGWRLHALKGELKGFHAITVTGNWRVVFRFVGEDVELVDLLDYH
jgi:toxin HigB-1